MDSFDTVEVTLASDVANAGTFTASYPANRDAGAYQGGHGHYVQSMGYGTLSVANGFAAFSFGASSITITNNSGQTLAAGTTLYVHLDRIGADYPDEGDALANPGSMALTHTVTINLGAPDTADADGVCASQAGTAATAMTINGALASGGVATFDVPRNVVAAWTNTATLTVTGTDEYGNTVVETSGSGTSMAGKKAFKTITSVVPSANITGATVGTGDVLGLPVALPQVGMILKEMQDGAAASAGTAVAAVRTKASATTGDVRGTYDPNAACDGSRKFQLVVALGDPGDKGVAQFAG